MSNYQSQTEDPQQTQLEAIVAERTKAIATIIDKIRRSQDIKMIFKVTTQEMSQALHSDHLIVYQFNPDSTGQVVAESVRSAWVSLLIEQKNKEVIGNDHIQEARCLLRD